MLTKKIYAARKFPTPITFLMVCPQISQLIARIAFVYRRIGFERVIEITIVILFFIFDCTVDKGYSRY